MNTNIQFDPIAYFRQLTRKNNLAREEEFLFGQCAGMDGILDVVENFQKAKAFVLVDDTTAQNTYSRGDGFFDRNSYTVFILARYRWDDMADRERVLNICRQLFHQFHTRMIRDKYGSADDRLTFLDVEQVYSKEFPVYSLPEMTGLYFMVNNDEPVDLSYNSDQWSD